MPISICLHCQQQFTRPTYYLERPAGPQKFCSNTCYNAYRSLHRKPAKWRPPATCHPEKPHVAFGLCTTCYNRKHRAEHIDAYRQAARAYVYRKVYKMSVADYQKMWNSQDGKCAICDTSEKLDVDHDHATGKVRALLCQAHNKGLGLFTDSPDLLERAASYLRAHGRA